MRAVVLIAALSLVASVVRGQVDQTVIPGAKGPDVVEMVCDRISAACIFPDDKIFTRRVARVETNDGHDAIPSEYYGGIWKVDRAMFDVTKSPPASTFLKNQTAGIMTEFGIDWTSVTWEDLTKPLYSGLAARLYIHYNSSGIVIPTATDKQAVFWQTHYRPEGVAADFVNAANGIKQGCETYNGADMIFVLDGSGSITLPNFELIKDFVQDVINSSDIGWDAHQTRVGLIQYSNTARTEFYLNTYKTKAEMLVAVERISYMGGGTYTHLGIDEMTYMGFNETNGARYKEQGHPRIGIVVTDGRSQNEAATAEAALRAHAAGINVIAVGVTSGVVHEEIHAIASEPKCQNAIIMTGFDEFASLKYIIEDLTCEAPLAVSPKGTAEVSLPPKGTQNLNLVIPVGGATMQVSTNQGTIKFYTSGMSYPNAVYYERVMEVKAGSSGLMYIEQLPTTFSTSKANETTMYASIEGDPALDTIVTISSYEGEYSAASVNYQRGLPVFLGSFLSLVYCLLL